jgi:hypothetical protein
VYHTEIPDFEDDDVPRTLERLHRVHLLGWVWIGIR